MFSEIDLHPWENVEMLEEDVVLPPRTRLFHLRPIANHLGLESLTGFIKRLAAEHSVSPRHLVEKEIFPLLGMEYPSKGSFFYSNGAKTVNGTNEYANRFVKVLQELCSIANLARHTLLPLSGFLSPTNPGLFRDHLAWCPTCMCGSKTMFERLEWTLSSVTQCSVHYVSLIQECPKCNKHQPILTGEVGYCFHCGSRLGYWKPKQEGWSSKLVQEEYFNILVRNLMYKLASPDYFPSQEAFIERLKQHIKQQGGGVVDFAQRVLGLGYDTVQQWLNGRNRPQFDMFIYVVLKLGIDPATFFDERPRRIDLDIKEIRKPLHVAKMTSEDDRYANTKLDLQDIVDNLATVPKSLAQVVKELNTSEGYLRYHFSDQISIIASHYLREVEKNAQLAKQTREESVRRVVRMLYQKGLNPTIVRVGQALRSKGIFKNKGVREAYYLELKALGLRK